MYCILMNTCYTKNDCKIDAGHVQINDTVAELNCNKPLIYIYCVGILSSQITLCCL